MVIERVPDHDAGWGRALLRNLRAGLAISLFRAPQGLTGTVGQVAGLAVINVLSVLLYQSAVSGFAGQFTWSGLGDAFLPLALWLVASAAACGLGGRPAMALALTAGMLAARLWIGAVLTCASMALEHLPLPGAWAYLPWALAYGGIAWIVLAFVAAAVRLVSLSWLGGAAVTVIAAVVVGWPAHANGPGHALWVRAPDPEAGARQAAIAAAAGESLLYSQPEVLARTLEAVLPRRPGRPNLYLVSVAGYAEQDVFMREVVSIDTLFGERFGTAGRSIKLINSRATLSDTPLATRTSLAQALNKVGSVMDRDEDILFLFLTSHGRPGRFSIAFYPLSLADLTPAELRKMLDDAGIRYRVIVVSACYSGSFVEALRNDDSLVITAAAADRNSFGCSNEADFTWFGKAFFDEALRHHGSFMDAFDTALPVIAGREKAEGYSPSQPQRSVGANVVPRLAAWQAALAPQAAPAAVAPTK